MCVLNEADYLFDVYTITSKAVMVFYKRRLNIREFLMINGYHVVYS